MKVVKDGKYGEELKIDPATWQATASCLKTDEYDKEGCGAEMEVAFKDLVLMYWRGTHFRHYYIAIRCPQCEKYNKIIVPVPIWNKIFSDDNKKMAIFDGFADN